MGHEIQVHKEINQQISFVNGNHQKHMSFEGAQVVVLGD